MKTKMWMMSLCVMCMTPSVWAESEADTIDPWVGKYPMSFFTKTRTAKTVGEGKLSVALKVQQFDWDQVRQAGGSYADRTAGQSKERLCSTLCVKYGWAKDHHIAVGIPYWINDFDIPGKTNDSAGLANAFIFEKWNCIKETNTTPAVAVDLWYYFPTGDAKKKLGVNDGAYKVTTEISKAWEDFSLHFNPAYCWGDDNDYEVSEINGGMIYKATKTLWPAVEYNYFWKEGSGCRNDIVPGIIWKFAPRGSFKVGLPINVDTNMTDKDEIGVVFKLFYKFL